MTLDYLQTWYIQGASRIAERRKNWGLRNWELSGKYLNFIE